MLTPKFSLRQNADFLFIQLHVPYMKSENVECDVNGDEFYFSSNPYYLRLHLPGNVVNDDRLKSQYDVDKGDLNIRVAKEVPGQRFDGLDMLTKLLTPKQKLNLPNIEIVNSQDQEETGKHLDSCENDSVSVTDSSNIVGEIEFDWFIDQKVPEDENCLQINKAPCYGFAHKKSNVIGDVCSEVDVLDLKDPDNVSLTQRTFLRNEQENDKFDLEYYLADLFDDELIQDVISADYPSLTGVESASDADFTDADKERLLRLPRREYIIEHDTLSQVCLGLVDLVYAYSYNYRFCGGESNVESDWTICKLSSTLSWLDSFHNLKDVIISCARRTLCFSLYRNWKLFLKVFSDVKQIFESGKHQILKCLLGIHSILETSESRYLLNELYITDYCVWIQTADCQMINSLALNLSNMEISKADVGFSIVEIEADAEKMMKECPSDDDDVEVGQLSKKMMNVVHVADATCADSDDDEDDDEDEEEESEDDKENSSKDSSSDSDGDINERVAKINIFESDGELNEKKEDQQKSC